VSEDEEEVVPRYAAEMPFPKTNTVWGASAYWDTRPLLETEWLGHGWQRVPGCCRVVHEAIPDPLPFYAPAWCGWRGVPSANGKIYDYETGREMRDYRSLGQREQTVAYGSRLKLQKKAPKE
jgi:hypothetical protein